VWFFPDWKQMVVLLQKAIVLRGFEGKYTGPAVWFSIATQLFVGIMVDL